MTTTHITDECNQVVYPVAMSENLEPLRKELRAIAAEYEKVQKLNERRFEVVERARAAGMTWREAAETLHMTQNGLIKTQQAMRDRGSNEAE